MSHRTVIANLTQGESAWVTGQGSQSFGNMYQLASFKGFLYSPLQGVKVVWLVTKTVEGTISPSADIGFGSGLVNLKFNIGGAWTGSQATIPIRGVYYIAYGSMMMSGNGIDIGLYINNGFVSSVKVDSNPATTIYREAVHVASLENGTTVSIRTATGAYTFGTGILGFLLYPQ